jgi:hypothetical protein
MRQSKSAAASPPNQTLRPQNARLKSGDAQGADPMVDTDEPRLPAGERSPMRRSFLIALTLFGGYGLAANAAIALHEFGHALGIWLAGGTVRGLYQAPQGYAGSYAARDFSAPFTTDHGRLLQVAGGPGFGAAFGVALVLAARLVKPGTVGWIATHGTGTWCLGNNGAYLALGSLVPFGDALFLTELGVPRWGLFLAGFPLVLAFVPLFAALLRGIGLRSEDSYRRWVLAVETGLLSYLAVIAGVRWVWPPGGELPPTGNDLLGFAVSPVAVWLLATCAYPFRSAGRGAPATEPRWGRAGVVLALGLVVMAIEVSFFSYDYEAATAARSPKAVARAGPRRAPDPAPELRSWCS